VEPGRPARRINTQTIKPLEHFRTAQTFHRHFRAARRAPSTAGADACRYFGSQKNWKPELSALA